MIQVRKQQLQLGIFASARKIRKAYLGGFNQALNEIHYRGVDMERPSHKLHSESFGRVITCAPLSDYLSREPSFAAVRTVHEHRVRA